MPETDDRRRRYGRQIGGSARGYLPTHSRSWPLGRPWLWLNASRPTVFLCSSARRVKRPDLPHSACVWASRAGGRHGAVRRAAVSIGHAPGQVRRVGCGHPDRGDEQQARRGSAHYRHRLGSGAKPGLGRSEHYDAGLGVRTRIRPVMRDCRVAGVFAVLGEKSSDSDYGATCDTCIYQPR
jgi:hypothetical protein